MTIPKRRNYDPTAGSFMQSLPYTNVLPTFTFSGPTVSKDNTRESTPSSASSHGSGTATLEPSNSEQSRDIMWKDSIFAALGLSSGDPPSLDGPSFSMAQQLEQERTKFLESVWDTDIPKSQHPPESLPDRTRGYFDKIAAIKIAYDVKIAELASSEQYCQELRRALQAAAPTRDVLMVTMVTLSVAEKCQALRRTLDRTAMRSILEIRHSYLQITRKPFLPARCVRILTHWFDNHRPYPYPNPKQKDDLALACGITPTQVSTWFCNKRCRSNCTGRLKGKGHQSSPTENN